jgi:hypothetical protein
MHYHAQRTSQQQAELAKLRQEHEAWQAQLQEFTGRRAALQTQLRQVRVWETATGKVKASFVGDGSEGVTAIAFSVDARSSRHAKK